MSKTLGELGEPGQILTYTCDDGFIFTENAAPASQTALTTTTTTTTERPLSWRTFKGAEYAKVLESCTWSQARTICQSAGGDLAKISDYAIQRFLNSFGSSDKTYWIGATDVATEGTWVWQDNSQVVYTNWNRCPAPSDDTAKNCAALQKDENGRWSHNDCEQTKHGVVCERGTSTSELFNTVFRSGEFAYIVNEECIKTRQRAKDACTALGADMATYSDSDIRSKVEEFFRDDNNMINEDYWIGLNDINSERNLEWDNGEAYSYGHFVYWASHSNSRDCVVVYNSNEQWDVVDCNDENNGVMCMKGRYEPPDPVPAEISNRQTGKFFDSYRCARRSFSSLSGETLQTCCNRCMGLRQAGLMDEFDGITVSQSGDYCQCASRRKTYCYSSTYPYWGSGYDSATCCELGTTDCAPSKRKKRSLAEAEENFDFMIGLAFKNNTLMKARETEQLSEIVAVDNSIGMSYKKEVETLKTVQRINTDQHVEYTRYKREVDALTTRQIECVNLWDGVKGYWKYDFEIPTSCYSKY